MPSFIPNLKSGTLALAVASTTAALGSGHTLAEDGRISAIEEIIVTAQKREESLQDAPISISAFTGEGLERIGANTALDVAEHTPNLTMMKSPTTSFGMSVGIRGISSSEPALSYDSKVGIYLDGAYIGKNAGAVFDVVNLERIEVLRGPQGTLYGKNTTGGAINLITKKPSGELRFKQQLTTGNAGLLVSSTSLDLPKQGDLSASLSYTKKESDGHWENINPAGPKDLGSEDTEAFRIAVRWEPGDNLTVDYTHDNTNGEAVSKPFQLSAINPGYEFAPIIIGFDNLGNPQFADPNDNPFMQALNAGAVDFDKPLDRYDLDGTGVESADIRGHNLTLSYALGDLELKSISAYRELDLKVVGAENDGGAWTYPLFETGTAAIGGRITRQQQFSQEFQLNGTAMDERLQFVTGLYYFEEDGKERNNNWDTLLPIGQVAPGIPLLMLNTLVPPPMGLGEVYTIDNKTWAVYSQFSYIPALLDDKLTLTLGLRYTEDEKTATILDATPNWTKTETWSNFNPSITADYQIDDQVNIYAKIATGYVAGGHPVRSSNQAAFELTVDEEEVVDYEVGLKSTWFNNRLRVNAAAYLYDYTDLQISDFQSGSSILVNAGEATLRGFELEATAVLTEGLVMDLNYGYTDYDYEKYINGGVDVSDTARAGAPQHTWALGFGYDFLPSRFGQLSMRVDTTFTDEHHFNTRQFERDWADDRRLINARVTLSDIPVSKGDLRIAIWAKNLEDEEYRDFGIDFESLGFAGNTWGEPRTYGLDVIYEFE